MKICKVLSRLLLCLLSVIICANVVLAEVEVNESIEVHSSETEEACDIGNDYGEILEKDETVETETPCLAKKSNRRPKLTKGENGVLFGVFHAAFGDTLSENDINSPLSVSVCAREKRRE